MKVKKIFFCAMFFNLGLSLVAFFSLSVVFWFLCLVVLGILVTLVFKKKLNLKFLCFCFLALLLGVVRFLVYDYNFRLKSLQFDGVNAVVCANVVEVKKFDDGKESYVCQISEVNDVNLILPIYVSVNGSKNFQLCYGDKFLAAMKFLAKSNMASNFGFSQSRAKSIYLNGKVLQLLDLNEGSGFFVNFYNARTELLNAIDVALDEPSNCLVSAIFLGQACKLPYNLQRSFSRCGLAHIFAVSGLHVSILFSCLVYLLKRLKLSWEVLFFILTLFLFCYNVLLGFCLSAIRASIMNLVYFFCYEFKSFRKSVKPIYVLGFVATLILIIWPNSVFSCSFVLSFSSCLGIALFFKPISAFIAGKFLWFSGFKKMIIELFSISVSAMAFSSIFVALFFGQISLIAPLINLIVMPFIPIVLVLSGCLAFSSVFNFDYVVNLFAYLCEGIFLVIVNLVNFCAKLPFCCVPMRFFIAPFIVLGLIIFLVFVFFYARSLFFSKLVALFCMFIIFVPITIDYFISRDVSCISFIGNGAGFSVVIKSLDKIIVLCCGGGAGCEKYLCKFLDSRGISQIDFLILLASNSRKNNYDILSIVDCFQTFCVMAPKTFKNSSLMKLLLDRGTYLILQEQARFENFPFFVDFLNSCKVKGCNCYLNLGGLDFAYCCSSDDFMQMQKMKFANVFIVDDEVQEVEDDAHYGFLISLKPEGEEHYKRVNLSNNKITEFVIQGSYLKEGGL